MNLLRRMATVFAIGAAMTGCVVSSDNTDATLRVTNRSVFTIEHLYVAPVGTVSWGPDQLQGDVLFPDESLTLGVACDFYDGRLVDETNAECIVHDLDLCANDAVWVITTDDCDGVFNAAAAKAANAKRKAEQAAKAAAPAAN
jgi:hypothetical protein